MNDVRLTLIGPLPPPVNGQSVVMSHMVCALDRHFPGMRVADNGDGDAHGWRRLVVTVGRSVSAWRWIPGSTVVYVAVKADHGMWLTSATAVVARMAGAHIFLHHHSYAYVRERKPRMVALTRAAGQHARHIVLSRSMASDLQRVMPEIRSPSVVGNAALVDSTLLDLPLRTDGVDLVLGHLSNLSLEKGIAEVVDLAAALHRAGTPVRLVVAGPTVDEESRRHLERAARELGESFEYRGPVAGESKREFFSHITHFVFPTQYPHEAVPLVLYEAMAAGAVCVSTRRGAIPEQLAGSPAVLADGGESFVADTLPALVGTSASAAASRASRQAFVRAHAVSESQLADLVTLLAARCGRAQ